MNTDDEQQQLRLLEEIGRVARHSAEESLKRTIKAVQFGFAGMAPDQLLGKSFTRDRRMNCPRSSLPDWFIAEHYLNAPQAVFLAWMYENPGMTVASLANKAGCNFDTARGYVKVFHTEFRVSSNVALLWKVRDELELRKVG